jgi:hypothetical protein
VRFKEQVKLTYGDKNVSSVFLMLKSLSERGTKEFSKLIFFILIGLWITWTHNTGQFALVEMQI